MKYKIKIRLYLKLLRLHTLPLSFAAIGTGIFLAAMSTENISLYTIIFLVLTAANFQIIANISNDYGDGLRGEDTKKPNFERVFQLGKISKKQIQIALLISIIIVFINIYLLLFFSFRGTNFSLKLLGWYLLGVVCIWAAMKYSLGKNHHNKSGLGDLSVFIFFGPVAVIGSYFLISKRYDNFILIESVAIGLLIVSVLNLNNIRDLTIDKKNSRKTVAIMLGEKKAKIYQKILVSSSFLLYLLAGYYKFTTFYQYLSMLIFLAILWLAFYLPKKEQLKLYTARLKQKCIFIFIFTILYGVSSIAPKFLLFSN